MEFERVIRKAEFLIPPDFKREAQEIEYRQDPLTGSTCIINVKRAKRARQAQRVALVSSEVTSGTKRDCFFCPEHIGEATPRFTANICPSGKIEKGECTVFPNLFAFAEYHAVATLSHAHFLDVDQFTPQMIRDNLLACQEWMFSVHRENSTARYPIYMWNHLPPSGASIVHPHVQALMREDPTSVQAKLISMSRAYFKTNGRNYWQELVEKEEEIGERYIGSNDSLDIIASFSPQGFREIQFVFKQASCFTDLSEQEVIDFADAITKVLCGYKQMGVGSFNLITFSGPIGESLDYYSMNAKIISRPFPRGVYTNDTGTFERLQEEWVIEILPEDIAQKLRLAFSV